MAEIDIKLNSTANTLSVTVDGKVVPNVSGLEVYVSDPDGDGYDGDGDERVYCTISTVMTDGADDSGDEKGMRVMTRMSTASSRIALEEGVANNKLYPGMVDLRPKKDPNLQNEITKYLNARFQRS